MIVYTVICRAKDAAILAEMSTSAVTGNAPQVTTALLQHLRDHPSAVRQGDLKTFVQRNDDGDGSTTTTANDNGVSHLMSDEALTKMFWNAYATTVNFTTTSPDLETGDVDEHYFHLWQHEGVFYCCLGDDADTNDQKVNFAFLQAIGKEFETQYSARRIRNANAYAMDKTFAPTLRSTMHYYNTNHVKLRRDQHVQALLAQVEDMKALMGRNIDLLLERDEKLSNLVIKSEQMKRETAVFKKRTKIAKKQARRKHTKTYFTLVLSIFCFFYLILALTCGVGLQSCRVSNSAGNQNQNQNNSEGNNNGNNNNQNGNNNNGQRQNNNNQNNQNDNKQQQQQGGDRRLRLASELFPI